MPLKTFTMNSTIWRIEWVDPESYLLIDRTGKRTVATTDPNTYTVYLSTKLHGDFLIKVLLHELGHCAMVSYDLLGYIHQTVYPERWVEAEEWVCNFIADYGFKIFSTAYKLLGEGAWSVVPRELEKLIA